MLIVERGNDVFVCVCVCAGVFVGIDLGAKGTSEEDVDRKNKVRYLLKTLIDCCVAEIFLHSLNTARKSTKKNLGIAVSLQALRNAISKFLGGKNYNIRKKRESKNQEEKTKEALGKSLEMWSTEEKVKEFIYKQKGRITEWTKEVLNGK